jgi:hypothetical protein
MIGVLAAVLGGFAFVLAFLIFCTLLFFNNPLLYR